jgi:hypothetical protein
MLDTLFLLSIAMTCDKASQPLWPLFCSSIVPGMFLPQDLCTCCALGLEPFPLMTCLLKSIPTYDLSFIVMFSYLTVLTYDLQSEKEKETEYGRHC